MSSPYNMAFACINCRKSFKREFNLSKGIPNNLKCPECGGIAQNFGRHFKPPKKSNIKQWKKIAFLSEHGFHFQKIGAPYPETLEEAKDFVIKYKKHAIKIK